MIAIQKHACIINSVSVKVKRLSSKFKKVSNPEIRELCSNSQFNDPGKGVIMPGGGIMCV